MTRFVDLDEEDADRLREVLRGVVPQEHPVLISPTSEADDLAVIFRFDLGRGRTAGEMAEIFVGAIMAAVDRSDGPPAGSN